MTYKIPQQYSDPSRYRQVDPDNNDPDMYDVETGIIFNGDTGEIVGHADKGKRNYDGSKEDLDNVDYHVKNTDPEDMAKFLTNQKATLDGKIADLNKKLAALPDGSEKTELQNLLKKAQGDSDMLGKRIAALHSAKTDQEKKKALEDGEDSAIDGNNDLNDLKKYESTPPNSSTPPSSGAPPTAKTDPNTQIDKINLDSTGKSSVQYLMNNGYFNPPKSKQDLVDLQNGSGPYGNDPVARAAAKKLLSDPNNLAAHLSNNQSRINSGEDFATRGLTQWNKNGTISEADVLKYYGGSVITSSNGNGAPAGVTYDANNMPHFDSHKDAANFLLEKGKFDSGMNNDAFQALLHDSDPLVAAAAQKLMEKSQGYDGPQSLAGHVHRLQNNNTNATYYTHDKSGNVVHSNPSNQDSWEKGNGKITVDDILSYWYGVS
ncbi:MAG TPA: hypothetical protein VJ577_17955 [Burkholderiaceae bacterium]|nr:hypothetical protein [Burkholderiaceae bacterium]